MSNLYELGKVDIPSSGNNFSYNYDKYSDLMISKFNSYQFIIFIDDLSFEEMETDYKIIKSALDGNIKEQPNNIALLYISFTLLICFAPKF